MHEKSRIAVFASGAGSNAEEIFKYFREHQTIEVVLLLSNKPDAPVLKRAQKWGVPSRAFSRQEFFESEVVLGWLQEQRTTHIVLAGFLWLIPGFLLREFQDRMVNIHPALLPKYGGKGMYGSKVHELVKRGGEVETGITIHVVNETYDDGRVLFQAKCAIEPTDTPQTIAEKVHVLEHASYPMVIEKWILSSDK